ncbi:hypothetical protein CJ030_MR7G015219 [Morella rubra]|uniref:Uncharacterized protein n=1 Tax=Morella rubra TaxID=262757 RepID=A0A6A1UZ66_9ROSI|nr:hypothetical protein CJ030_MR7G015219 [Morella rubra]
MLLLSLMPRRAYHGITSLTFLSGCSWTDYSPADRKRGVDLPIPADLKDALEFSGPHAGRPGISKASRCQALEIPECPVHEALEFLGPRIPGRPSARPWNFQHLTLATLWNSSSLCDQPDAREARTSALEIARFYPVISSELRESIGPAS